MFAVTVTFTLRLGHQANFVTALTEHVEDLVSADTNCIRAEAFGDPARPGKAMLIQVFDNEADFEAYRGSQIARDFDSKVVDVVTARAIATWSEVSEAHRAD